MNKGWLVGRKRSQIRAAVLMYICMFGLTYIAYLSFVNADRIRHFYITAGGLSTIKCVSELRYNATQRELLEVCTKLNAKNITYWLDDGTLLGMMREERILKQDTDNDIGILYKDKAKVQDALGNPYYFGRLTDIYRYEIYRDTYLVRKCEYYTFTEKFNFIREISRQVPHQWFLPPKKLGGAGAYSDCYIPANPDGILRIKYGPQYMDYTPCSLPRKLKEETLPENRPHAATGIFC